MPPPPLLQNHTWQTPGFRCLQKGRWGYPTPWQRLQKKIRRILGKAKKRVIFQATPARKVLSSLPAMCGAGASNTWTGSTRKSTCQKKHVQCSQKSSNTASSLYLSCMWNILYHICQRCADACLNESRCCSYEFSPTYLQCNLNKECRPTQKKFRDFLFCKKT